jgi:hypothetical protein
MYSPIHYYKCLGNVIYHLILYKLLHLDLSTPSVSLEHLGGSEDPVH